MIPLSVHVLRRQNRRRHHQRVSGSIALMNLFPLVAGAKTYGSHLVMKAVCVIRRLYFHDVIGHCVLFYPFKKSMNVTGLLSTSTGDSGQYCTDSTIQWVAIGACTLVVISELLGCSGDNMPSGMLDARRRLLASEYVRQHLTSSANPRDSPQNDLPL